MKSSIAVMLLATAIQAQQELSVARNLYESLEHRDDYERASTEHYRDGRYHGHEAQHHAPASHYTRMEMPAGYAYPRNPHSYYPQTHEYEEHHTYQYHPIFANDSEVSKPPSKMHYQQHQKHFPEPQRNYPRGKLFGHYSNDEEENKGGSPPKGGSPAKKGGSPGKKGGSPAKKGGSPQKKGGSPGKKGGSPQKKGGSPAKKGGSPQKKGGSPQKKAGSPSKGQQKQDQRDQQQQQRQDQRSQQQQQRQREKDQRQDQRQDERDQRQQQRWDDQDARQKARQDERDQRQQQRWDDKDARQKARQDERDQKQRAQQDKRDQRQRAQQDQRDQRQRAQQDQRDQRQRQPQDQRRDPQPQKQQDQRPAQQDRPQPKPQQQKQQPSYQDPSSQGGRYPAPQQPSQQQKQQPQPSQPEQKQQQQTQPTQSQPQPQPQVKPHTPMPTHGTYTPGADVTPVDEGYRGFRAPYQQYPSSHPHGGMSPYGAMNPYTERYPYGGYGSRYPSFFPQQAQVTYPYAETPGVSTPYRGQIQGYDQWGRPVYKPISPYDDKKTDQQKDQTLGQSRQPGQPTSTGQRPGQSQPGAQQGAPGSQQRDPNEPRTLGLVPQYGEVVDPYSEIGFPQMMNPYMQKKAMKAYWKQQKYLAKYGGMGMGAPMPYPGGMYSQQNGIPNDWADDFSRDEDNVLGIVHPASEGSDMTHRKELEEPQYVTQLGREFALLDWGEEVKKPSVHERAEPEPQDEEDDTLDLKKASKHKSKKQKEVVETEEEEDAHLKKKKDKKKGKKPKHNKDKPVRREEFGDFEDHFSYDVGTHRRREHEKEEFDDDEGEAPEFAYHVSPRHLYDGDEDADHYGYNNEAADENGLLDKLRRKSKKNEPEYHDDHHYSDEKRALFNHQHPRYFQDHHESYKEVGAELEWPGHMSERSFTQREHLDGDTRHTKLVWPEEKHDESYYDTKDEHFPESHDFSEWRSQRDHAKWYEVDHEKALKNRERKLYGSHYEHHETSHQAPWLHHAIEESHELQGGHNKHYESTHKQDHAHMAWPEEKVSHDEFASDFGHQLIQDEDIYSYQRHADEEEFDSEAEEDDWYGMYEAPTLHAPLNDHGHRHIVDDERHPTTEDFYTFDWHASHPKSEHETHFKPFHEQGAIEKHLSDHQEADKPKKKHAKEPSKTKKTLAKEEKAPATSPKKAAAKSAEKKNETDERYVHADRRYHDGEYEHFERYSSYQEPESDDEYPVYPYEASIFYDVKNGYDIYYDPHYESPYDLTHYDSKYLDDSHYNKAEKKAAKKEKKTKREQERYGVPLRRPYERSPYKPRQSRRNGEIADNETPMYVRPFLEDPLFLQPDDDEISRLHPHEDVHGDHDDEYHHAAETKDEEKHHVPLHDLEGDPDLENPDSEDEDELYEEEPHWIEEHHQNVMDYAATISSNEAHNPNGFRKKGELCNHNFECISGKCMSWLNKAPTCMPF